MSSSRAVLDALRAGDPVRLRAVLDATPELASARDERGRTLLHAALHCATGEGAIPYREGLPGHREAVRYLLSAGVDPNAADADGCTALHLAALAGHLDLIDWLLEAGADPTVWMWGLAGGTPLALALFYAKPDDVQQRLDRAGRAPDNLRVAAGLGDVPRVRSLFAADGTLLPAAAAGRAWYRPLLAFPPWTPSDARQELLDEALTWAARSNRIDAMAELVARGADVNSNVYRGTALLWATYSDRVEAAAWLLDHGADVNLRHDFGGAEHGTKATALHLAAQFGCVRCIELLMSRGADLSIRDGAFDSTPRGWAEHGEQPPEVIALLEAR